MCYYIITERGELKELPKKGEHHMLNISIIISIIISIMVIQITFGLFGMWVRRIGRDLIDYYFDNLEDNK